MDNMNLNGLFGSTLGRPRKKAALPRPLYVSMMYILMINVVLVQEHHLMLPLLKTCSWHRLDGLPLMFLYLCRGAQACAF
jgi:hypothetical protein